MGKPETTYELTGGGGDRYPSLEAAQAAALKPLAQALAIAIRRRQISCAIRFLHGAS